MSKTDKLLLIAFDGLSKDQFADLLPRLGLSETFLAGNSTGSRPGLSSIDTKPHLSAQGAWAELLTGKPWYKNGCSGYSYAGPEINELNSEDTLNSSLSLIQEPAIVINLPLVKPSPNRYWLGDGSLPLAGHHNIEASLVSEFLENYRPRPQISAKLVSGKATNQILDFLDAELARLALAEHLLKNTSWKTAFIRLNLFDTMQHLMPVEPWQNDDYSWSERLKEGLLQIGQHLKGMTIAQPNTTTCFLSTYSHTPCLGRVNLNEILYKGGFCQFAENLSYTSERRLATAHMLKTDKKRPPSYMVAKHNIPRLAQNKVVSPVYGTLYAQNDQANSAGQNNQNIDQAVTFISSYLRRYIETRLEVFPNLDLSDNNRPSVNKTADCMLYLEGYDFYSTAGPALDLIDKPYSCHQAQGFVAIFTPEGQMSALPQNLNLTETSQILKGLMGSNT